MRKLMFGIIFSMFISACTITEPVDYLNKITYELNKSSDFDYTGTLEVRERTDGKLELVLRMFGATANQSISYPAHLHFGSYDTPDAEMAAVLNPVNANTLTSITDLSQLADGSNLTFEEFKSFDGHIKVHLASEGPDYKVILVAGNVGSNIDNTQSFNPEKITICSDSY